VIQGDHTVVVGELRFAEGARVDALFETGSELFFSGTFVVHDKQLDLVALDVGLIPAKVDPTEALKQAQEAARGWEVSAKSKQRVIARLQKENAQLKADARK